MTPEAWQRIKEIFQGARELPAEEREAHVAREAGGDEEIRRAVERMLRHATGAGPLDRPAWEGMRTEGELEPGAQLGPYEIVAQVGAGGMGRVYEARDTRLGRRVAVKVLRAEFSHRLRREGRAISALNHPHVCALYDIGDQNGTAYLVMEYVEGESLAARLKRGPLATDDAVRYGAEIADALAAAHAQGIVHRDLKPANIMITASGVKVLDFGVARMTREDEEPGTGVVGTAAYMSPSQLNGNPAEARSDVFALGLVLREMVAGRPAPDELRKVIDGCLRADSSARIQEMEQVRRRLEQLRARPAAASRTGRLAAAFATGIVLLAGGTAAWRWEVNRERRWSAALEAPAPRMAEVEPAPAIAKHVQRHPEARREPERPPSLVTLASYPGQERDPSLSPDGTQVAFAWHYPIASGFRIAVRPVKSAADARVLTEGGTEDWGPAWSPGGKKIAFRRRSGETGIYWVAAAGGLEHMVARTGRQGQETLPQLAWSPDGKWIAAPDRGEDRTNGIYLFGVDTGERRAMTVNETGVDHAPAWSPDGKSLAYASCTAGVFPCDVYVLELGRGYAVTGRRRVTEERTYLRGLAWMPDSRNLVYSAGNRGSDATYLWRVEATGTGAPERLEMAGSRARHPTIAKAGGMLAFTKIGQWNVMGIENFR